MGRTQYIQLFFRILLIALNSVIIFYSYQNEYLVNTIGFSLLLFFQIFLLVDYIKRLFSDIEKSIDCLLHDDFTNTISAKKRKNSLHNKTALLLEKNRKKSLQKISEELIFTNIIESLSIGILILRKDKNNTIEVFQLNKSFVDFLKIPKFYNWNLLQSKLGLLVNLIKEWKTLRHTISLDVNNEKESFFLKTSVTQTHEYQYLVLSLETIQQLIDKKEKEAWYKLMNVMSHEIINTITPISSLAENLEDILHDEPDQDTINELKQGLKIIKKRSCHLTSFVDTYRKLAELPLPQKSEIDLTNLVSNTLELFQQEFITKNINIVFNAKKDCIINADRQQIEQVIINIISNCLYALEAIENPIIEVDLSKENKRTHLSIKDNGIGISDEIKDNIFIPYFTTRKNGSGIGLTLAKSILEAHNGRIDFTSKQGKTNFILSFLN